MKDERCGVTPADTTHTHISATGITQGWKSHCFRHTPLFPEGERWSTWRALVPEAEAGKVLSSEASEIWKKWMQKCSKGEAKKEHTQGVEKDERSQTGSFLSHPTWPLACIWSDRIVDGRHVEGSSGLVWSRMVLYSVEFWSRPGSPWGLGPCPKEERNGERQEFKMQQPKQGKKKENLQTSCVCVCCVCVCFVSFSKAFCRF